MKIPHKIFGVAMLVFAIMALSIFYTTFKIQEVGDEVEELSQILIPLSNRIADIDTQIVTQQLHVVRLEKLHADAKRNAVDLLALGPQSGDEQILPATGLAATVAELTARGTEFETHIAAEEAKLAAIEAKVDASVAEAKRRIIAFVDTSASAESRIALSALLSLLEDIDRQHSSLHAQLTILAETLDLETGATRFKLERLIEKEQTQLNRHMNDAWGKIAAYTADAAGDTETHQRQALQAGLALTGLAGVIALILAAMVIKGMLRPLRRLIVGATQVEAGDLTGDLPVSTRDEIGELTRSFNGMIQGLRRTEEIKHTFGQYVDPRVVSGLIGDSASDLVQGEKKVVSVYFSDLVNFTGISERFTPAGLVKLINRYLTMMSEPIIEQHGLIDKYIGDAIMAFWTEPFCAKGDQASLAVAAALQNAGLIDTLRRELPDLTGLRRDLPEIGVRMGIATGEAIVGSIGSETSKNYTIMGDTVNLGSRLEGANKVYGTTILVCERTRDMAAGAFEFRKIDHLLVKGKTEPVAIFEPLGPVAAVDAGRLEFKNRFEQALAAFHKGEWQRAGDLFSRCRDLDADDRATATYMDRLAIMTRNGAPENWDGIWRLETK